MSVTRIVIVNLCFYAICLFFGFVVVLRLLLQFAIRGRRRVLYVRPRLSPPACLQDQRLGRHDYVQLKDVRLHYVETGDRDRKPLLLCLHGFPEFWYSWRHQLHEFRDDFWVVAVDMRGYGDSDKPSGVGAYAPEKLVADVEQLIRALGRKSCVLMGHDQGGVIAWMFAEQFPQMVDRLIVLNASHPVAFFRLLRSSIRQFLKSWFLFFAQLPYLPELYLRCNDLSYIERALRSNTSTTSRRCEHDVEAYKHAFSSPGALTASLNHFRNLRSSILYSGGGYGDVDRTRRDGQVTMPVLILWGADDSSSFGAQLARTSREHHVDRTVECIVHIIKGAGRFVQQDAPDIVNSHIRLFLIDVIRANNQGLDGSAPRHDKVKVGGGWPLSLAVVRKRLASSVSLSALKLSSRMPVLISVPVFGQVTLKGNGGWMGALNRKLLST